MTFLPLHARQSLGHIPQGTLAPHATEARAAIRGSSICGGTHFLAAPTRHSCSVTDMTLLSAAARTRPATPTLVVPHSASLRHRIRSERQAQVPAARLDGGTPYPLAQGVRQLVAGMLQAVASHFVVYDESETEVNLTSTT
jgi:hypothetical protein